MFRAGFFYACQIVFIARNLSYLINLFPKIFPTDFLVFIAELSKTNCWRILKGKSAEAFIPTQR